MRLKGNDEWEKRRDGLEAWEVLRGQSPELEITEVGQWLMLWL